MRLSLRVSRALPALVLTVALAALAGCGDDEPDSSGSGGSTGSDSQAADPGGDSGDPGGSGGSIEDICTVITAEEVTEVVGAPVTVSEVPGGGCTFNQEDPRGASISFATTPYDEGTGGLEGAKSGVTGVIEGTSEDLDLGDGAFLVIGTALGGESQQGGGAVVVGGSIVQVNVIQAAGLPADEVKAMTQAALELVVDAA